MHDFHKMTREELVAKIWKSSGAAIRVSADWPRKAGDFVLVTPVATYTPEELISNRDLAKQAFAEIGED